MGRPFNQQLIVVDNDTHNESTAEEAREDQLTIDLVELWDVSVTQYVQREAQERVVSEGTVRGELTVSTPVFDLLGSIPRLLARNLIALQDRREETVRELRQQQVLQRYEERNSREEEKRETSRRRTSGT